jgi:hypothetical protein
MRFFEKKIIEKKDDGIYANDGDFYTYPPSLEIFRITGGLKT